MVCPIGLRPSQVAAHEALVDHHHAPGSSRVLTGEVTARSDGDPQRGEVAGADIAEPRGALFARVGVAEEVRPRGAAQRNVRRRCGRGNARDRADLARQLLLERDLPVGREILRQPVRELHDHRPIGVEADVDRGEISERLDEQQRGEDQHQRDRDLRNHEAALKSRAVAIDGHAAGTLSHDGQGIDGRYADGREQPEQDRGHGRGCADERHQPPVSREVERDAACRRAEERHQRPAREQRDRQSQDRAGGGDQQALDQHLRHQPPP